MPELPDVLAYLEALEEHARGRTLERLQIASPFVLRSVEVAPKEFEGRRLVGTERLGKRVVLCFEDDHFAVVHLYIAGRLRWREPSAKLPAKRGLLSFHFDSGQVWLTEEGSKRRASLHLVRGRESLAAHEPGGRDVLACTLEDFTRALLAENHTLKRALTDPRTFSGIGNAYSDEILHRARLSPVRWTQRLTEDEIDRLHRATQEVLHEWIERLREQRAGSFPEKVTAFHPRMAAHGRHGEPCPVCGTAIQRIRYADKETNYCPTCQTGGKLLADRSLSRLLRGDWPSTLEELEDLRRPRSECGPQEPQPKSEGS